MNDSSARVRDIGLEVDKGLLIDEAMEALAAEWLVTVIVDGLFREYADNSSFLRD